MASINVSEADFEAVAGAANDAQDRGDTAAATALDKIARKINAALSKSSIPTLAHYGGSKPLTWNEMPSTLIALAKQEKADV